MLKKLIKKLKEKFASKESKTKDILTIRDIILEMKYEAQHNKPEGFLNGFYGFVKRINGVRVNCELWKDLDYMPYTLSDYLYVEKQYSLDYWLSEFYKVFDPYTQQKIKETMRYYSKIDKRKVYLKYIKLGLKRLYELNHNLEYFSASDIAQVISLSYQQIAGFLAEYHPDWLIVDEFRDERHFLYGLKIEKGVGN